MFNDKPSNDTQSGGKRVSYTKKPDSFSIGWAVEETNGNRKKKQEIQGKIGATIPQSNTQPVQRAQNQQQEPQREKETYRQVESKQPRKLQYTEHEVLESLRKYDKLADMPQDELDKVLLYYEDMKGEESPQYTPQQPQYQPKYQPQQQRYEAPRQESYQPRSHQPSPYGYQQPYAPSSSNSIQTRQPIRPKDSIKGMINNQPLPQSQQGNSRFSQKNKSTLTLGDGYNPFSKEAEKAPKRTEFERIQENEKKPQGNQGYKISNIFG